MMKCLLYRKNLIDKLDVIIVSSSGVEKMFVLSIVLIITCSLPIAIGIELTSKTVNVTSSGVEKKYLL